MHRETVLEGILASRRGIPGKVTVERPPAAPREIPLHGPKAAGRVALVDDSDYELVSAYRWCAVENSWNPRLVLTYAVTHVSKRSAFMHRLITGYTRVDHADNDGLNNQRWNLREATAGQNLANARLRSDNTSGYKGVCWAKDKSRWSAQICADGRTRHLGYYATAEDAARAYDAAALAIWGEFAHPNFP